MRGVLRITSFAGGAVAGVVDGGEVGVDFFDWARSGVRVLVRGGVETGGGVAFEGGGSAAHFEMEVCKLSDGGWAREVVVVVDEVSLAGDELW
jgi:hypothetical protein